MSTTLLTINPTMLFKTSKGSKYYISPEMTTQRIKSLHVGHDKDDVGLQEVSDKTVYVSNEVARSVTAKTTGYFWLCFHHEKLIKVHSFDGKITPLGQVEYSTVPQVGLCPVEFWKFQDIGRDVLHPRLLHVGNEIVSIEPVYTLARELYERDVAEGRVNF